MRKPAAILAVLAVAVAVHAGTLDAQGFQVNEHGTCQMGRGGTGVAAPCADGSAMFGNPAGIVGNLGWTISLGTTVIDARGNFTDDRTATSTDLDNSPIPVPHLYVVKGFSERFAAGLGVFVPYGLGTQWPVTFEGRFNGYDNSLQSIYLQPTVAYELTPTFSVGAGFDFVLGRLELTQRVDLSEFPVPSTAVPPGTLFGQLGIPFHTDAANGFLEGHGTGFGGHIGVLYEPNETFSVGARYMTRVSIDYDGTVDFDSAASLVLPAGNPLSAALGLPPGPLPIASLVAPQFAAGGALEDGTVATSITMPDQITVGVAVSPTPDITFLADYQWVHWSLFDTLEVDFGNAATTDRTLVEDFDDTHAVRVGFDWATSDRLNLRAGYIYHTAAAPPQTVTPLLPEGKRNEITFGLGYAISDVIRADVAYQYIKQQDRRGRVRESASPNVTDNSGLYEFFAHLLGVTLTARF